MPWIQIEGKPGTQEEPNPRNSPDWLSFGLIAAAAAAFLAMVATWFLVAYSPIPDDNAVYLGLLGFLFVVIFDLILIAGLAVSEVRQGEGMAAIKLSVSLFLLGLLVASVVGSLPLLWQRVMTAVPGLRDVPWGTFLLLWIAAFSLWRRRKPTQENHGYPRGWLIVLIVQGSGSALVFVSHLVLGVIRLSSGKVWAGALDLAVALLFGILAGQAFVELWKRRQVQAPEIIG